MYKICFYAPIAEVDKIKNALFQAGAGTIGKYRYCAWQILGEGQFLPLEGSHAFIGEVNRLEKCPEYKVEMICAVDCIQLVVDTLKKVHPYEEPAYQVIKLENF